MTPPTGQKAKIIFLDCNRIIIGRELQIAPLVQIYTVTHPLDATTRRSKLEFALPVVEDWRQQCWIRGAWKPRLCVEVETVASGPDSIEARRAGRLNVSPARKGWVRSRHAVGAPEARHPCSPQPICRVEARASALL